MRAVLGEAVQYKAENTLLLLTMFLFWALFWQMILTYVRKRMADVVMERVEARMSEYIFDKLLNLPTEFFERTPVGEITYAIGQTRRIRDFMSQQLFGVALDAAVLLFFLPALFYISWVLAAVSLVALALMAMIILMMMPSIGVATGKMVRANIARGAFLYQNLAGMRTVKSLALEARQRNKWDGLVAEVARTEFALESVVNILRAAVFPFEQMAIMGAMALGAYLAVSSGGFVDPSFLFLYVMIARQVVAPLIQLTQMIERYGEFRGDIELIAKIVNRLPEENAGDHGLRKPLNGHIEFSNLRFRYEGAQNFALDGVSFEVPVGTTLGLVGRSGSGKTTVTRLLQRLHAEYEGVVKIDGVDMREYDLQHLRRSLGVVLQENFLFSGSIRENIIAAKPSASFDEVVNACRLAGAEEFIDRLPRGYDTYVYEGSPNLSGGQRQRLAIARALIVDPKILILDEATSALDPDSEAIVNDNISRIAKGRTMLVVSHRLSSLVNSDAILVLERGKVADIGPHFELLERCEIYRNLWNQQNRHTNSAARLSVRGPTRVS
jgi:ATP-binding cassette, subfamily B, bacterial HlyB/CyaB